MDYRDRCDTCGKFVDPDAEGVSWSTQWEYDGYGEPTLLDREYRCPPCTDELGVNPTNCYGDGYNGRNPARAALNAKDVT